MPITNNHNVMFLGLERCKDMYLISIYNAFSKVFFVVAIAIPYGDKKFSQA